MRPSPFTRIYDADRLPWPEASLVIGVAAVLTWIALLGIVCAGLAIWPF